MARGAGTRVGRAGGLRRREADGRVLRDSGADAGAARFFPSSAPVIETRCARSLAPPASRRPLPHSLSLPPISPAACPTFTAPRETRAAVLPTFSMPRAIGAGVPVKPVPGGADAAADHAEPCPNALDPRLAEEAADGVESRWIGRLTLRRRGLLASGGPGSEVGVISESRSMFRKGGHAEPAGAWSSYCRWRPAGRASTRRA